jgi:uncharacterized DUF497 family protein
MADFDPAKDAINQAKHGISLARWVDMEIRAVVPVEPFEYGEPRYRAFGLSTALLIASSSPRATSAIGPSACGALMQRN